MKRREVWVDVDGNRVWSFTVTAKNIATEVVVLMVMATAHKRANLLFAVWLAVMVRSWLHVVRDWAEVRS
jgi:hypothetical protein